MTTKRFIDCTGRMMDATPHILQADAQARGLRAIKLIDEMDSFQCEEGLDAEALATMAREAQIHAELAAAQANRAIDAGGVVAIIRLLPGEKLGLSAALEYAYDDQKNYLEGDPNRDYGGDWYDTRHNKIAQFKGMAAMAELIGESYRAGQFRDLAFELQVEEDADDEQTRKQNAQMDALAKCPWCGSQHGPDDACKLVTVEQLALHRGMVTGENGNYDGAAIAAVGLSIMGGCEVCEATIAAYNAYPAKTGNWRCENCIGDQGWIHVEDANRAIFPPATPFADVQLASDDDLPF